MRFALGNQEATSKKEKVGPDGKVIMKPVMVKDPENPGKKIHARFKAGKNKGKLRYSLNLFSKMS